MVGLGYLYCRVFWLSLLDRRGSQIREFYLWLSGDLDNIQRKFIATFRVHRHGNSKAPYLETCGVTPLTCRQRELRKGSVADLLYTFCQAAYDKIRKMHKFLSRPSKDVASPEADHMLEKPSSSQSQTHVHEE
jgi:hypothetical protein